MCFFNIIDATPQSFIKALFPLTYSKWWFASTYFVLYLLHPFLNILIKSSKQETMEKLLILTVFCWSIIPTFTSSSYQSNNLLWFVTLYCISAYIRIYGLNPKVTSKQYIGLFIFFVALLYTSSLIIMMVGMKVTVLEGKIFFFYGRQSIFVLIIAVTMFMVFRGLRIGCHKWINIVASTTFGVYLIHDNPDVRELIWSTFFKVSLYQNRNAFVICTICIVCVVFAICSIIDMIRQVTIEKLFLSVVDKMFERKSRTFTCFENLIENKVFGKCKK